ncbi:acyl carrier protein [Streptomyces sp. bgisy095]|uniref:acyl carrier protein n=1 Tax=unclassified Streptomyces TaxID=2593676 RepID=UPI003D74D283
MPSTSRPRRRGSPPAARRRSLPEDRMSVPVRPDPTRHEPPRPARPARSGGAARHGAGDGDVRARITAYLARFLPVRGLADDEDIFGLGYVSSVFGLELLAFVEEEFGVTAGREDLDLEDFRSVGALVAFVGTRTSGTAAAPDPSRGPVRAVDGGSRARRAILRRGGAESDARAREGWTDVG